MTLGMCTTTRRYVEPLNLVSRKDYGDLCVLRKYYPNAPILAISATCPPRVLGDVIEILGLKSIVDSAFSVSMWKKQLIEVRIRGGS